MRRFHDPIRCRSRHWCCSSPATMGFMGVLIWGCPVSPRSREFVIWHFGPRTGCCRSGYGGATWCGDPNGGGRGGTRKVEKAFESEPEGANEKSKSRTTRKKSKSRTARETRTKTNTRLLCRLLLRLLLRHLRVLLSLTLSLLICLLLSPSVSGSRHLLCLLL